MNEEYPKATEDGAVLIYLLGHLISHLGEQGTISTSEFADRLAEHIEEVPERSRPLLFNIMQAIGVRPTRQ